MQLGGIYVPVITPFDGSQQLDLRLLEQNIRKLNATPVAGYMPLGSNGEAALLTDEEAYAVAATVKTAAVPGKQLFAGVGRESAVGTIDFIRRLAPLGYDAVFVLTPHFFPKQMTEETLAGYYREVADHSPLPVILYNAPGYAGGVSLGAETVAELATHPNIIGMKDSSSSPMEPYIHGVPGSCGFSFLAGTLGKLLQALSSGAAGGVLSAANYMPHICCQLEAWVKSGEASKAETLHRMMTDLAKNTTGPLGVPGVKAAMNLTGYLCGPPRRPLLPANDVVMRSPLLQGIAEMESYIFANTK